MLIGDMTALKYKLNYNIAFRNYWLRNLDWRPTYRCETRTVRTFDIILNIIRNGNVESDTGYCSLHSQIQMLSTAYYTAIKQPRSTFTV